jgi:hypothetical protein
VSEFARALLTKEQLIELGELKPIETPENAQIYMDLLTGLTESGVDGNV